MREVLDKATVEIGEAKERLDFFFVGWFQPLRNSCNLDWIHFHAVLQDDKAEVVNSGTFKLAFFHPEVQFVVFQLLKYSPGDLSMFCNGLGKDQNVVQVDHNHAL